MKQILILTFLTYLFLAALGDFQSTANSFNPVAFYRFSIGSEGNDITSNNNDFTNIGSSSISFPRGDDPSNGVLNFNRSSPYKITGSTVTLGTDYTVQVNFLLTTSSSTFALFRLSEVTPPRADNNRNILVIRIAAGNNRIDVFQRTNRRVIASVNIPLNTPQVITFVKQGPAGFLYLNGVQVGAQYEWPFGSYTANVYPVIGAGFGGWYDEIVIWNQALFYTNIPTLANLY